MGFVEMSAAFRALVIGMVGEMVGIEAVGYLWSRMFVVCRLSRAVLRLWVAFLCGGWRACIWKSGPLNRTNSSSFWIVGC